MVIRDWRIVVVADVSELGWGVQISGGKAALLPTRSTLVDRLLLKIPVRLGPMPRSICRRCKLH
jgi:hypothetical protein